MAKRAASTTSPRDSSSPPLNDSLPHSARQQLAVLRSALETRLAALEEVLADPSRGESLAGMILDLSRVATEEAQAAAAQACIATKVEADKEMAALRASARAELDTAQSALRAAEASLERERATSIELRRAVDQAQLGSHKQADLLTAREQLDAKSRADRERLEAEVRRHQSIATDLQRAVAEARQQLETARRSNADWQSRLESQVASTAELQRSVESATARLTGVERDLAEERSAHEAAIADLTEARSAHDAVVGDLARERKAVAERELALAGLQSQLEAQRASDAELKRAAESAAARLTSVERELADERSAHEAAVADLTEKRAAHDAVVEDLARERKDLADRERAQALLRSQLEAERATVEELRQAVARAEELGASLDRETASGRDAHAEAGLLQQSLADARNALASTQAELETERASMAELRHAFENTDQQLSSARSNEAQAVADQQKVAAQLDAMVKEREAVVDELTAARKWINDLREAEAEFALPPAPPHVETPPTKTKAKTSGPASAAKPGKAPVATGGPAPGAPGEEETWQAVRLANRYVFNTELSVQVNGDTARLFDLSVSGCQLLSSSALKPHQLVKVLLPATTPVTCAGKVVWTRLEPMGMGQPLGYRAGVRFTRADEVAIEAFATSHTTSA